jgi:3-deoxy-manno-octulosonate cytidylyltransferase (CMP-KDO synthetase)
MQQVIAVVPARYGSTRFPGKPLALIAGKPMIQHVYERVSKARLVNRVIVATDDQRIVDCVMGFSGEVVLTRADHPTGTDRLAEVAAGVAAELIVNVQGDEPLIQPQMIDQAVAPLLDDERVQMGTLAAKIDKTEDFYNPNVVKVVRDLENFALYFSRAPIPWPRDLRREQLEQQISGLGILRHIGLYVYRRRLLLDYPTWPKTPLETLENLEQLRALERGVKLYVGETQFACHGVDTPADLERVEGLLREEKAHELQS